MKMLFELELDKKVEKIAKKEASKKNISLAEYFNFLVLNEEKKENIKQDLIESMQELNLAKQGKIKLKSINNLFNA